MGLLKRARPAPAIVVAILALVAGVTGAAVAQPTAKKAVTKKKVKKIAKKQAIKQINELAPGLSVANAETAQDANTLQGKPASAFASPTEYRTEQETRNLPSFANGGSEGVTAECDPGERVVGGGGTSNNASVFLSQSSPVSSTEWHAQISNLSGNPQPNTQITALAVCASAD